MVLICGNEKRLSGYFAVSCGGGRAQLPNVSEILRFGLGSALQHCLICLAHTARGPGAPFKHHTASGWTYVPSQAHRTPAKQSALQPHKQTLIVISMTCDALFHFLGVRLETRGAGTCAWRCACVRQPCRSTEGAAQEPPPSLSRAH